MNTAANPADPASDTAASGGDRCPRCGGGFHCGANDPAPCACNGVRLDEATLAALRARYAGCLCLRCLVDLAGSARPHGTQGPAGE